MGPGLPDGGKRLADEPMAVDPTGTDLKRYLAEDPGGEVVMLNLLSYKESGADSYALDGAGDWQIFWRITWVLLLPLTTILTIFSAIFTFTDFQLIWTITRGGPANATHLFVTLAYQRAIPGGALGEGAAIAGVTLPFLALLAWAALDALRRPD